jgi:hypothetical protein
MEKADGPAESPVAAPAPVTPAGPHLPPHSSDGPAEYPPISHPGAPRPGVLRGGYRELRAMTRMFTDRRYRPSWTSRIVPPAILLLILTSWLWLPGTSILPGILATIFDKIIDLALALCAFEILSREARRYRETIG